MAHILLPTDLSDASMHAAEYAVNVFGLTGNRFSFFHAYELALEGVPHSFLSAHGMGAVDGSERLAETKRADMIAVLHRHVGVLARMFQPSATKGLAIHARFPLLVLEQGRS